MRFEYIVGECLYRFVRALGWVLVEDHDRMPGYMPRGIKEVHVL